jgi:hypothetical protein
LTLATLPVKMLTGGSNNKTTWTDGKESDERGKIQIRRRFDPDNKLVYDAPSLNLFFAS